ncbi:MAG: inorganic phosphate transporter [Motilibacteraceae bacterium]
MTVLLVVLAVGFAYSMGAHYTGACMGMPHALGAVDATRALLVMAPLTLLGAALASHKVEVTVGHDLLVGEGLSVTGLVVVIAVAFGLTSLFNVLRIPTSTIQILVFTVVGAGLAAGIGIHWAAIGALALIWVCAPPAAALLGFALTRILDLVPAVRVQTSPAAARTAAGPLAAGLVGAGLVAVGALASFAMGGNDVANATGSLVGIGTFGPAVAGLLGGLGLAAGVLTWGRPLLRKVAFDLVAVDPPMATAAQLVQAAVVLGAVAFGFFTSMNQALIGAMAGAGAARGRHTVHTAALWGVLRGWVVGPGAGIALGYACSWLVGAAAGAHVLLAG